MAHILGIGIVTLDIVNSVEGYPAEDAKVRAVAQSIRRGGNTANTLTVLAQLGHRCALASALADDPDSRYIRDDLAAHAVGIAPCKVFSGAHTPISYIVHNRRNGSRTIVHHRDLPEYPFEAFQRIDLSHYDWCHFEGRNIEETAKMLHRVKAHNHLPCSLEVEKARPGIERLFADRRMWHHHANLARPVDDERGGAGNQHLAPLLTQVHGIFRDQPNRFARGHDGSAVLLGYERFHVGERLVVRRGHVAPRQ